MRRVISLELTGLQKLDCDLYDENGQIIYEKETCFTPQILTELAQTKIFKRDEQNYSKEKQEPAEYKTVLNAKKAEKLIKNVKEILNALEEGVIPKTSICLDTVESICEEVYEKCDKVTNICRLRIYDDYSCTHSINTAVLSAIIGRELGFHEDRVKDLAFSGFLHDIGQIKISSKILYKSEKLSPEEFALIKNHSFLGYEFIRNEMNLPEYIAKGALEHHERWHGDGYPKGLKGREISEFGQIIAIADVFDALVSEKIYKHSVSSNDAVRIMLTEESKSFNPEIFHKFAFLTVVKKIN